MKWKKRIIAAAVLASMLMSLMPQAFAAGANEYAIANSYITYTFNTATGGFSIETVEGHPQKQLDNHIPLLYKDDAARSNGTSFATIRVNDTDYIFGQDYGWFGLQTTLEQPVVSEQGRLITTKWTLKTGEVNITAIQRAAISLDENTDRAGNVAIEYELINNDPSKEVSMGVRLLLDAALDSANDAPYVLTGGIAPDSYTEASYAGGNLPSQIRFMDSLSSSQKMAYTLLSEDDTRPDKVTIGHWANLANTRYDYEPDPYFDYTSYSNSHRVPDTAAAYYWEPQGVAAGSSRTAQLLYGVGNFSSKLSDENFAIGIRQIEELQVNEAKDGYENNGEFGIEVTLDNLSDGGFTPSTYTVSLEEGLTFSDGAKEKSGALNMTQPNQTLSLTVKAAPQQLQITSKRIVVSVSGYAAGASGAASSEYGADMSVLLPVVSGKISNVSLHQLTPANVYHSGPKSGTISGEMSAFSALHGSDDWDLYLIPQDRRDDSFQDEYWVRIEKKNIAFLDESYSALSFSTDEDLAIGAYDVSFVFQGDMVQHYGTKRISAPTTLNVTDNELHRMKLYGLAALVRYNDKGDKPTDTQYDIFTFRNEGEYAAFHRGESTAVSLGGKALKFDTESDYYEVLAVIRGQLRQMKKDGVEYLQADPADADVTINNMLAYCGEEPLVIKKENGEATISADGLLRVINSISVWRYEWSIKAKDGAVYYLEDTTELEGTSDPIENAIKASTASQKLRVNLEGAASMIQSIAGTAIKLQYGVLTNSHTNPGKENDEILYGINFGGKISLPIKAPASKKTTEQNPDAPSGIGSAITTPGASPGGSESGSDDSGSPSGVIADDGDTDGGKLAAEVRNVLYGQKDGGSVGFKGINATFKLALPQDVLGSFIKSAPGIEAEVVINTIENIYALDFGVDLAIIECEAVVGLKQVPIKGTERLMLDEVQFGLGVEGPGVPVVPPFVSANYLGGGISDLADSVSDDMQEDFDGLPPVTIHAKVGLVVIGVFEGKLEAALNLYGMKLDGQLSISGVEWLGTIYGSLEVKWHEQFELSAYGRASFLGDVISGGITLLIRDDYFYGYIYAAVHIPKSIPLVGGVELGRVEAAVSTDFIGANVKIIGIRFGLQYYWDGKFVLGKGVDLSSRANLSGYIEQDLTGADGSPITYYLAYGTNLRRLTAADSVATRAGKGITKNFDPTDEEALLFEVRLNDNARLSPEQIILTNPHGERIPMVYADAYAADYDGSGNYMIQERTIEDEQGKVVETRYYLYISITDKSKLASGDWTLTLADNVTYAEDFSVDAVDTLPAIETMAYQYRGDRNLNVSWGADATANVAGTAEFYLTRDPQAVEKLKQGDGIEENLLTSLGTQEFLSLAKERNSASVTIPQEVESGTYYVVTMLNLAAGGMSVAMGSEPFAYVNENEPIGVETVSLSYGGDGRLSVDVTEPENADYTDYIVTLKTENGDVVTEELYDKNSEILLSGYLKEPESGQESQVAELIALTPGETYYVEVKTRKSEDGTIYYGQDVTESNRFRLPNRRQPQLVETQTNIPDTADPVLDEDTVRMSLAFDDSVRFAYAIDDSNPVFGTEYAQQWDVETTVQDGSHVLYWKAMNEAGDTVSGSEGFTVDTQPPVLNASQSELRPSMEQEGEAALGGQTVFAQEDGSFVIYGMTEPEATLTLDGSAEGCAVAADGSFTVRGQLDTEQQRQQVSVVTLRAVDKAGHEAMLNVNVLNGSLAALDGISVLFDAMAATGDEIKSITLSPGQSVKLDALGIANSREVNLEEAAVYYSLHGEDGVATLQNGVLTALKPGNTVLKAAYPIASVNLDGKTVDSELSQLITVKVEDPGYSFTLLNTSQYTIFALTPKVNDGAKRSVTLNGVHTDMLYDSRTNTHLCAFEGMVGFTAIKEGLEVSQQPAVTLIAGDYDNNGTVGSADVAGLISTYIFGLVWDSADPNRVVRSDLNGDGVVNVLDALLAAKKSGGEE